MDRVIKLNLSMKEGTAIIKFEKFDVTCVYIFIQFSSCANDRHIIPDLTYDASLITAFTESHVFKYADKPSLYFACTVVLCFKQDGGCNGITVNSPNTS